METSSQPLDIGFSLSFCQKFDNSRTGTYNGKSVLVIIDIYV
jgi:hypothetical protein